MLTSSPVNTSPAQASESALKQAAEVCCTAVLISQALGNSLLVVADYHHLLCSHVCQIESFLQSTAVPALHKSLQLWHGSAWCYEAAYHASGVQQGWSTALMHFVV